MFEKYDPNSVFCINGMTPLHMFANNYKQLKQLLEIYEKMDPKLTNLLLLKSTTYE